MSGESTARVSAAKKPNGQIILVPTFMANILKPINMRGPMSYGALERATGLSKATLMVYAQRLEDSGLAKRTPGEGRWRGRVFIKPCFPLEFIKVERF